MPRNSVSFKNHNVALTVLREMLKIHVQLALCKDSVEFYTARVVSRNLRRVSPTFAMRSEQTGRGSE